MRAAFFASVGLVAYAFVGYPALAAALARFRPKPLATDPSFVPEVSLVIAAYNEADIIKARLDNVAELDYPRDRLEVIVVADGSDDGTPEVAAEAPGTRVLYEPERRGKLEALKRAAAAAGGTILVVSDANNRYTPETLRELVAPFADPGVGIVTGRKAIDDGAGRPLDRAEGLYWRYESKLKEWESAFGSAAGVAGEILAFRREAFLPPKEGTMNEDFVFAMEAALHGWRVVYAPRAVSLERASATLADEGVRRSRLVTGRWQALWLLLPRLARRNPAFAFQVVSHKGLRPLVPFAMIAAAASNVALARQGGWPRLALALHASFYAAALVGWQYERKGTRNRALYLPYYFCKMNLVTLEGFMNFVRRRREFVWAKVERG